MSENDVAAPSGCNAPADGGTDHKPEQQPALAKPHFARGSFDIVVIASSLGGIAALGDLLGGLSAGFPIPILVCQHVRQGKPSLLPGILAHRTGLRVMAARQDDRPMAGTVHVAPPDRHLLVQPDGRLAFSAGEPVNFCRPAADVLFGSVAAVYGPRAIAVVLSGLGRDGAFGVRSIRAHGGFAIAQDEGSAVACDMPLAARDIGQADLVLPLGRIATALTLLAEAAAQPDGAVAH